MGKSYKEFRRKTRGNRTAVYQWIGEAIVFAVSSAIIWVIHKKWLVVVSEDWLAGIIAASIGLIFAGIFSYFQHRHIQWEAAWEYSNQQEEKISQLENQLRVSANDDEPNLPFEKAIELVKNLQPDNNYSTEKAKALLVEKAHLERITVWGKPPKTQPNRETNFVKIPYQFFYSPDGSLSDRGYYVNVGTPLPGWKGFRGRNKYYYVTVNRRQIEALFSNR